MPLTLSPTVAVRPVVLPAPQRGDDLLVRVTAPAVGADLPVVVLSHGFGSSMDGYGPLADAWAAAGLVVVQPTHLDSTTLDLRPDDPRTPHVWRHRIDDLRRVLDDLDVVAGAVDGLADRLDSSRVAVAGHSYGATTASALLGARVIGPAGDPDADFTDPRVRAGVLLCLAGHGGADLSPLAAEAFPFMHPAFDRLAAPALIVAGDADQSLLTTRGPDWFTDGYADSPGPKALLTVAGAEHGLGGIHAHLGMAHPPAEDPATVRLVQRVSTAYLLDALGAGDAGWAGIGATLGDAARLEGK